MTPKVARISVWKAVEALLELPSVRRTTVFQSPDLTVVATYHNKPRKNERSTTVVLTIGKPNFRNRQFVKNCIKAGEPFPVRKVQLEYWPEKK